MANKNVIKFSTILRRSQCLNSLKESTNISSNCDKLYNDLKKYIEENKNILEPSFQNILNSFIENMCEYNNANQNYWYPLDIIKEFNNNNFDSSISDKLLYEYCSRIITYIDENNLSSIDNYIDLYNDNFTNSQKSYIKESVNSLLVSDRILKNHDKLSEKYFIENIINHYKGANLKTYVEACGDIINTYNIPEYQKMNITLEESVYLLEKNGIKEDKSNLVKSILEYYLSKDNYNNDDINKFKKVFKESYILDESDLNKIDYLFNSDNNICIESVMNSYLVSENKSIESLNNSINNILENTTKEDIVYNSDKIINTIWDFSKNKLFESNNDLYKINENITDYIIENSINNIIFTKNDISVFKENINNCINNITVESNSIPDYYIEAKKYIDKSLVPCVESLSQIEDIIYSDINLEAINYVNNNTTQLPINEFKIFKFHNLVRAAFNLDKFLKVKEKKFYEKTKTKVSGITKKAKNILFGESFNIDESNILKYVGEDCRADICVRQYFYNESELNKITEFVDHVCSEYNDVLLSESVNTSRAYYIINPNIVEIRIKESTKIEIENIDEIYTNLDDSIDTYLESLGYYDSLFKTYDINLLESVETNISKLDNCYNFSMEQFTLTLEALSILGVDKRLVESFAENYINYRLENAEAGILNESCIKLCKTEREINTLVESWNAIEEVDIESKLEAADYLQQIFEFNYRAEDYEDDDDDEDEDDDEDKKPSKPEVKKPAVNNKKPAENKKKDDEDVKIPPPSNGKYYKGSINLNNIKLGLMGLKNKFKELDTKQKEASRNLDAASRVFAKSIKDSLVSNRREAIIKGSVIPSFSRCIKAGIVIAGIGLFSLPAAIIAALGGLALSAKLTKQERLLLLDEIETELDVVEKELSIAESNNQMNKYRELLKYKKNLQRQYQRIRYNIRVGKDILPGSATGQPLKD